MIHGFAVGNTNSGGGGGGITAINISAGTTSSNTAAVTFADGNGISFGYDGSNITATVQTNYLTTAMASNRGSDFVQATAAFHGTNASGTINSNNISVSVAAQSAQSFKISAGLSSSNVTAVTFSNANGVSFGYDGTNITATVQTNYLTTAMASNRGSDFVQATAVFHGTNASGTIASGDVSVSVAAQSVQTQNNVDISLSGNTSGALALISSGTAIFAGGNNITLSQNGQSVTISAFNQTVQTQNLHDLSLSGNTAGVLALISSGTAILAGGNNITLSQNGQSVTISGANTVAQTVQTQNCVDLSLSGNTSGVLALISSGTAILAGGNNITLSQNGQSITISAANTVAQTVQTQNCVDLSLSGNTTGTLALISSGTAILAGGNNITLSQNGQSVTISAASQTVQTQHVHDLSLSGNTTGTLTLISSGTAILAGGNNITLSQNGQSITISAFNQSVQTQNNVDLSLSGNTTGTLTLISSGTAILAGGNNITLSQNGQSVTISAFNQSVQTQNCVDLTLGGNTTGTLTLISSGTAFLAGGNNITLSQNGQSVTISCGAAGTGFTTASTAGSNIVGTLSTNGLSMVVPNYLTTAEQSRQPLSYWANLPIIQNTTATNFQSNSFYVFPITIPEKISISYLRFIGSIDNTSTTIATSAVNNATGASTAFSLTNAMNVVLYTVGTGANSRSLQYVYSSSGGFTWAVSVSQASTSNASQQSFTERLTYGVEGITTLTSSTQYSASATNGAISTNILNVFGVNRYVDIPFATSLSAGNYWMAMNRISGTVGGKNMDINTSTYCVSQTNLTFGNLGAAAASSFCGFQPAIGQWTTNVAQTTSSIGMTAITAVTSYVMPFIQFINQA